MMEQYYSKGFFDDSIDSKAYYQSALDMSDSSILTENTF